MSEKIKLGITVGDVNGVGLEIIIKTLFDNRMLDYCTPIVYGHTKVASFHRKALGINDFSFNVIHQPAQANAKRSNMINCWEEDVKIELGQSNDIGGKYAMLSLKRATEDLVAKRIDALVTAPLNKHNIVSEQGKFVGHTEYLQQACQAQEVLMFLLGDNNLRVGLVTGHIPIGEITKAITKERILRKLDLMHQSLKQDFWIEKPKIAVLGLNPHAGDNGLLGKEEQEIILPAIAEAKQKGIMAVGVYAADAFWAKNTWQQFDAVLAMYHDQGLIPFKAFQFDTGVNFTAGLPFVRTSPDHGTAYDIAGKNIASEQSFRNAIFEAINIVKKRSEHQELNSNPLKINKLSKDRD